MKKRIQMIGFLMAVVGLLPTVAWASMSESMHYYAPSPGAGDDDDMGVGLKVLGFTPIHSGPIDLAAPDAAAAVASKAVNALCRATFATLGPGVCTVSTPGAPAPDPCFAPVDDALCCADVTATPAEGLTVVCTSGGHTFGIGRLIGTAEFAATSGENIIANLNTDNRSFYPDFEADLASKVLLQALPNGINGTLQVVITHTQGGQNPKIATVANLQSGFASNELRQNAIRDAINALSFSPDVVAVTHAPGDACLPLTYFEGSYNQDYFVEITNAAAAGVTRVRVTGVTGWNMTVEPTENVLDPPALGSWGIAVVVAMLLASGYWLMRRRKGAVTA